MSRLLRLSVWGILVFLFVFTGLAFAAGAAAPEGGSLWDQLAPIVDAFKGGDYPFAASLAVVFAVALIRRYGATKFPFVGTAEGATLLAFVGAFAGTLAAGLSGDGTFSATLAANAFNIAIAATGGYALIKLFADRLTKSKFYQERAPSWFKNLLSIVLWMFETKKSPAITAAEEAGEEAVKKDPPKGMGEITELK